MTFMTATQSYPPTPLSETERSDVLDAVVAEAVSIGARVESRSPTQVVLIFGSTTSGGVHVVHFLLTLLTCGLWAFVWALAGMRHEDREILTVDPYGEIVRG